MITIIYFIHYYYYYIYCFWWKNFKNISTHIGTVHS